MRAVLSHFALLTVAIVPLLAVAAGEPPHAPHDADLTELVPIPAGVFTMGVEGWDEMPAHQVRVDAFLMDRT